MSDQVSPREGSILGKWSRPQGSVVSLRDEFFQVDDFVHEREEVEPSRPKLLPHLFTEIPQQVCRDRVGALCLHELMHPFIELMPKLSNAKASNLFQLVTQVPLLHNVGPQDPTRVSTCLSGAVIAVLVASDFARHGVLILHLLCEIENPVLVRRGLHL